VEISVQDCNSELSRLRNTGKTGERVVPLDKPVSVCLYIAV